MEINITQIQSIEKQMLKEIDRILTRHGIYYMIHAGSVLGAIRHKGPIPWDDDVDIIAKWEDIPRIVSILRSEMSDCFGVDFHDINKKYDPMFPRVCLRNSSSDIVHVDVFPLVGLPDDRKQQIWFSKVSDGINYLHRFYYKDIGAMKNNKLKRMVALLVKAFVRLFPRSFFIKVFNKHCSRFPIDSARYVMNSCGQKGTKNIFEKQVFFDTFYAPYDDIELPIPKAYDLYLKQLYMNYMELPSDAARSLGNETKTVVNDWDYGEYLNIVQRGITVKKYKTGYTTGVFDLFHVGHLNIIKKAKEQCEHLIVGVSTDELVMMYKKKKPVIPFEQRISIVGALKYVDEVIPQTSMDKLQAWNQYRFDAIFHGDDWKGSSMYNDIEMQFKKLGVDVVFIPHTDGISSTDIAKRI